MDTPLDMQIEKIRIALEARVPVVSHKMFFSDRKQLKNEPRNHLMILLKQNGATLQNVIPKLYLRMTGIDLPSVEQVAELNAKRAADTGGCHDDPM